MNTPSDLDREPSRHSTVSSGVVISPRTRWSLGWLKEPWNFRELLYFFAWRDVKVRYKQTLLGAAWAVIQPVLLMVVFTVVFGNLAGVSSEGDPYPVFALSALVPWILFSQSLTSAANSLVNNQNLVSKVYFPRLIIPISAAGSFLVDFCIGLVILGGMLAYYSVIPSITIVFLPLFVLLALIAALGTGILLSALNVRYRDIRYAVPFMMQVLIFASPLGYSSDKIDGLMRVAYALNPMTAVAEGFRWSLLDNPPPTMLMLSSILTTVALFTAALMYFKRAESSFADII
jgi:lipopolysaccharide transport system permease protein